MTEPRLQTDSPSPPPGQGPFLASDLGEHPRRISPALTGGTPSSPRVRGLHADSTPERKKHPQPEGQGCERGRIG